MKLGKVSQTIQKRSVLNLLKERGCKAYLQPKMEEAASVIELDSNLTVVSAMATGTGNGSDVGVYPITRALTEVYCKNGVALGVQVMIHFPQEVKESRLKAMVQAMEEFCSEIEVPILNLQVEVTHTVTCPQVTVTALGEAKSLTQGELLKGRADLDVVMIGEVGLEGSLRILTEKKEELEKRFAPSFLRTLELRYKDMSKSISGIQKASEFFVNDQEFPHNQYLRQVPESGILGGLWELAEASKTGLEIQLRELPISQEVIEVCEYMGVNPYRLGAAGTTLMLCENAEKLIETMNLSGFTAKLIGKTTQGNEKILCNGEDVRHIERPTANELYKVLEERQEEC